MAAVQAAFEQYPNVKLDELLQRLEAEASANPPASPVSPRKRRPGRVSVWPRDCSMFIADERRIDKTDKKPYSYEAFMDEYGPEQVEKNWAKSKPKESKTNDIVCGQLCALVKKLACSAPSSEQPQLIQLAEMLVVCIGQQQAVQSSAGCLSSVCRALKGNATGIVDSLKQMLVSADNHLARRSAAMGLCGAIKGLGLGAVKDYGMVKFLQDLVSDSNNPESRTSALICYELLFSFYGYPFEPYVLMVAPNVIQAFDDGSAMVRAAAKRTGECMLSTLSAVAVRLLMPSVIAATNSRSSRLKSGATLCLGSLTMCDRKALSVSLPVIVPLLAQLVNDAAVAVQSLAATALENMTRAIPNPEVKDMAPKLLVALSNPQEATEDAIKLLMKCSYVHQVDPASLAFLMPILTWGLKDKRAETKRCSVQIVGTLVSLVRSDRDLLPYLEDLNDNLRLLLTDAIPDTRLFAARAFGMLLEMYGESFFADLVPWLMARMVACDSQVVTDGASDGLAEVLGALGVSRLEALLPDIGRHLQSPTALVRTCFFKFLYSLPVKFPSELKPYIAELNLHALRGFADTNPEVRASALNFGVNLVQTFHEDAEALILPTIRTALWSDSATTQEAALMLLGYLLARMAGETELNLQPDEMQGADAAANKVSAKDAAKITEVLGEDTHHNLLINVSIMRSCTEPTVSNMAGRVLRSLVANINTKVAEMFDEMMEIALPWMLGKGTNEQAAASQRALGSLAATNKLLEPVMLQLTPLCELLKLGAGPEVVSSSKSSPNATWFCNQPAEAGVGLVITLTEVVTSGNAAKQTSYVELFLEALLAALHSPLDDVRDAGALMFLPLRENYKEKIVDPVLKSLVLAIEEHDVSEPLRAILTLKVKNNMVHKAFHNHLKAHASTNKTIEAFCTEFPEKIVQAKGAKEMKKAKPEKKAGKKKKGADFADPNATGDTSKAALKKKLAKQQEEELKIQNSKRAGAANAAKDKVKKKAFKCSQ